jgi:hypothetical protein
VLIEHFLHCCHSVTAAHCCGTLERLQWAIHQNGLVCCATASSLCMIMEGIICQCHLWLVVAWQLWGYGLSALQTCSHHLFTLLKKHLAGNQFAADADMKRSVSSWPQTLDTDLKLSSLCMYYYNNLYFHLLVHKTKIKYIENFTEVPTCFSLLNTPSSGFFNNFNNRGCVFLSVQCSLCPLKVVCLTHQNMSGLLWSLLYIWF